MDLFTPHIVTVVGITLAHFLWQGTAIGVATAAVLATCPRAMARTRYLIAGAGLVAMTAAPLVTLGLVWQSAPAIDAALPSFSAAAAAQATAASLPLSPAALAPWLPIAVGVWALGVLLLTTRLVVAWLRTEQVRRRDVQIVSDGLRRAVRRLARDLGITRPIGLFESPWIDAPTVIGWLRPTILLPVGALTGLSVQQIEAVLSHELAHIKRHDYLVNVLQHLAETVFFYHPAVWWLSRQIRIEREHCCDDVAVEACGNAAIYARALAALEESRQRQATFALAATDGSLVDRVRRLVGPAHVDARRPSLPIAVCVAVILTMLTFGAVQARSQDRPAVVEATQAQPARIVLPPGSTLTLQDGDGTVTMSGIVTVTAPGSAVPSQNPTAVPFERVDAATIQVDGVPYKRGTAEDVARLARSRTDQGVGEAPPLRVGGNIKEPRKIRSVNPAYPQVARDAGISGVVILEAVIDTDGLPVNLKILRSIPELDQAAINAVRQWRYTPTLLNGVPVAVVMTVTVHFTLQAPQGAAPQGSVQALEQRYSALQREAQGLDRTPDEMAARRAALQSELARLEQQLVAARQTAAVGAAGQQTTVPVPAADDDVLRVGGAIEEPRKIRDVRPIYPEVARAAGVSGIVIIEVTINTEGDVTDARILRSIPLLDQAALEAIVQWKYQPVTVGGVPTPVKMTATVMFRGDD